VNIELINTGTELMLGRVLNTHQQWLCRQLADSGYIVVRQVGVSDNAAAIETAVREALSRADLVITTGGLGPTSDDRTREVIAQLAGKVLREDSAVLGHIRGFFEERKRPMPEGTRVQALVPEGANVLHNRHGTAPGLAMEFRPNPFRPSKSTWLFMLPGPPRELRPMFIHAVLPRLRRVLPTDNRFVCRTLRATGIGESMAEERISRPLTALVAAGLEIGYCARPGQVDIRLAAQSVLAGKLVTEAEAIVRAQLGPYLYGQEDEEIEEVVIRMLAQRGETLALAESCTGGCIAHRLTNIPGASAVLLAGIVSYSNKAKQKFLGVSTATLQEHGAVSKPVAQEMAEGGLREIGATYALAVTGIAGPSGGTPKKPAGTVFIALAGPFPTKVERNLNPFDRKTFKDVTSQQAFELLRRSVLGVDSSSGNHERKRV